MFIVLDVDKTLATSEHRDNFTKTTPPDWDTYFSPENVRKDKPVEKAKEALERLKAQKHEFVVITNRDEKLREVTSNWLFEHYGLDLVEERLIMRQGGNMLSAAEFKREALQSFRSEVDRVTGNNVLVLEHDEDTVRKLAPDSVVLRAPDCWKLFG